MADPARRASVYVFGRVSVDLTPLSPRTRLEDVERFERSVGGFAGNVSTGLARLGVPTAIISAVGDDGLGRYARRFLAEEGVDIGSLLVNPSLRTALAFYELWPPDTFPVTLFRLPTCPDWEIAPEDLPLDDAVAAPFLIAGGTGLARPPSRASTARLMQERRARPSPETTTLFDLDWREGVWADPSEFAAAVRAVLPFTDLLVGGRTEFDRADLTPAQALAAGIPTVVLKRGPEGATLITEAGETEVDGLETEVVNGLGAGDAFVAAFVAGLLRGADMLQALAEGNAAGAIVAGRAACSVAMPTVGEIEAAMASSA
jgi:5-dehydro-2-deoxygluconokinase